MRLALRWLILLFLLLRSATQPRAPGISPGAWCSPGAVTTPGFLIGIALLIREALKQLLADPASARRAIFAGYNDISLSFAERVERNTSAAPADRRLLRRPGAARLRPRRRKRRNQACLREASRTSSPTCRDSRHRCHLRRTPREPHLHAYRQLLDDLRDTTVSIYYVPMVFPFDSIQGGTSESWACRSSRCARRRSTAARASASV